MSPIPNLVTMSQTDIECGFNENSHQHIPLNRLNSEGPSCSESVRRQKMRHIFDEVRNTVFIFF